MSTLNLEADIGEQLQAMDERKWSALQTEICMNVANAKFFAFVDEAARTADFVRLGILTRPRAAECLHISAAYNQLYFEYGTDRIQAIIADAFESMAA
jgi:hypothetical protein